MNEGHEPIPNFNPYTRKGKALIARVKILFPGVTTNEAVHCIKTGIWARPRPVTVHATGPVLAYRVPGIYAKIEFKTTDKTEAERRSRLMDKLMVENSSARNEGMIQALRRLGMDRP
jgi:hypothetical protein